MHLTELNPVSMIEEGLTIKKKMNEQPDHLVRGNEYPVEITVEKVILVYGLDDRFKQAATIMALMLRRSNISLDVLSFNNAVEQTKNGTKKLGGPNVAVIFTGHGCAFKEDGVLHPMMENSKVLDVVDKESVYISDACLTILPAVAVANEPVGHLPKDTTPANIELTISDQVPRIHAFQSEIDGSGSVSILSMLFVEKLVTLKSVSLPEIVREIAEWKVSVCSKYSSNLTQQRANADRLQQEKSFKSPVSEYRVKLAFQNNMNSTISPYNIAKKFNEERVVNKGPHSEEKMEAYMGEMGIDEKDRSNLLIQWRLVKSNPVETAGAVHPTADPPLMEAVKTPAIYDKNETNNTFIKVMENPISYILLVVTVTIMYICHKVRLVMYLCHK